MISPIAIVDTIASDLAADADLPTPKTTRLYAEPNIPQPNQAPLLGIWTDITDYDLLTGSRGLEAYERKHTVFVAWWIASKSGDTAGQVDPATVHALEQIATVLDTRLATYASGLPGTSSQAIATIRNATLIAQAGSTWRAAFQLIVEDAS